MRTVQAVLAIPTAGGAMLIGTLAVAEPVFSTGGPCVHDAGSQAPDGSRQVLLSNPSKVHLEASLKRTIDKPNFHYLDADGKERLSAFPYRYPVFVPPHETRPVGCTSVFVGGGVAAQTFALEHTDYFLAPPTGFTEEARPAFGVIREGTSVRLLNLHATRAIHVTVERPGGAARFDLPPQGISKVAMGKDGALQSLHVIDVRF